MNGFETNGRIDILRAWLLFNSPRHILFCFSFAVRTLICAAFELIIIFCFYLKPVFKVALVLSIICYKRSWGL